MLYSAKLGLTRASTFLRGLRIVKIAASHLFLSNTESMSKHMRVRHYLTFECMKFKRERPMAIEAFGSSICVIEEGTVLYLA